MKNLLKEKKIYFYLLCSLLLGTLIFSFYFYKKLFYFSLEKEAMIHYETLCQKIKALEKTADTLKERADDFGSQRYITEEKQKEALLEIRELEKTSFALEKDYLASFSDLSLKIFSPEDSKIKHLYANTENLPLYGLGLVRALEQRFSYNYSYRGQENYLETEYTELKEKIKSIKESTEANCSEY